MADFEKVWSVKIEAREAIKNLEGLQRTSAKVEQNLKRINKGAARNAMNNLAKDTKRATNNVADLKKKLLGVRTSFKVAGAAAVGMSVAAIRSNIKLNESMANVQTLLSGGTEQTIRLKQEIQALAMETGKPTADLADGLYEVVSALGESSDNMEQLGVATRAAIAGKSSTIGAVKLLAAVTKGYGDTSSEAQKKTSDLAFTTVKLGQTTFPELAASMGRVVPLAAAMNTTQEELFGTMATLTGVTGDTAEVSTQLASVYSAFMKPTAQLTTIAKKYGFESAQAMIKAQGLAGSIKILSKETDGNEGKLAKLLRRKEALVAVLALAGGQADVYEDKLAKMKDTAGATDEAFGAQTKGINAQGQAWKKATQQVSVFSQQLGDTLAPALTGVLDTLTPMLSALQGIDQIKRSQASEEAYGAEQTARTGTTKQKADTLKNLVKRRAEIVNQDGGTIESIQTIMSNITGTETPREQRQRAIADLDKAIKANMAATRNDIYTNTITGMGQGQQQTNNNNITINVKGSKSDENTAAAISRALSKDLRKADKSIGSGG